MGLKEFKIQFDKPRANYAPGEIVTGKVCLITDSAEALRGVKITFRGFAYTHWSQTRGTGTDKMEYTGKEEYFKQQVSVLGSESGRWLRGEKVEVPPGSHTYPFQFDLPSNLPTSFESELGYIRYTVKATLDRPWSFDQETKAAFTVVTPLDLNLLSNVSEPVVVEKTKKFRCLCCATKPLTLNFSIPVKAYVPGQTIPVKINVENQSGIIINELKIILQQCVTYIGDLSYSFVPSAPETGHKKVELVVLNLTQGPIDGTETVSYEEKLEVPSLPPSNLDDCKIINLEYKLKIKACVPGFHRRNLTARVPIIIGTVPLFSYEMPQLPISSNYQTNVLRNITREEVPISFEESTNPLIAPPSYEECIFHSNGIKDHDESEKVMGIKENFAPRYPLYKFSSTYPDKFRF